MTTNPPIHTARRGLHPMLWVAASAATIFALAGTAYVTGFLPRHEAAPAAGQAAAPAPNAPNTPTVPSAAAATPPAPPLNANTAPAAKAPVAATEPVTPKAKIVSSRPQTTESGHATRSESARADNGRSYSSRGESSAPPTICRTCGIVESNRAITKEGEGSGLGAVAGGVVGGVLGNGVGQGTGRNLATIAGAIGGAVLGNKIEKNQRKTVSYQTTVRFEDGTSRVFVSDQQSPWQPGDRVKVVDGRLTPR